MDVSVLAKDVAAFLTPFLPYLLKAGEKAAEKAGEKMGAGAWERARTLWGTLRPKVEARPAAQEAVQDVAQSPADPDAQAALRLQLKKILAEDPTLAAEAFEYTGTSGKAVPFGGREETLERLDAWLRDETPYLLLTVPCATCRLPTAY